MLAIEMLQGGHGDALVVEYGKGNRVRRLLVDAGTAHAYDAVRKRLLARRDARYDAFVITHVDEDHIGGAVKLLQDPDLRHRIDHVWFNGYAHCKQGGNVLGPLDGERLTQAITTGGYTWNAPFAKPVSPKVGGPVVVPATGDLPSFALEGGATLTLLSPTGPKLRRMATEWENVVVDAGLVPGKGTDLEARAPKSWDKPVKALPDVLSPTQLSRLAAATAVDGSAANGASIAFILEYDGARALLAADAHPTPLVSGLRRYGRMKGEERVRIDICKLPHHGSRANVTTALIEAIDATCYLVSTDGRTFGHPDDAALARVLCASASSPRIYCNYASERTRGWIKRAKAAGGRVIVPGARETSMRVEVA
ncbi:MAG: MBL fold metallo-hydrolase [Proteobacteria bacterium]|nr:MBL fold metallo-hydrolase [Pseudomonadota bacterium]